MDTRATLVKTLGFYLVIGLINTTDPARAVASIGRWEIVRHQSSA
jgi:hypothetical protein